MLLCLSATIFLSALFVFGALLFLNAQRHLLVKVKNGRSQLQQFELLSCEHFRRKGYHSVALNLWCR